MGLLLCGNHRFTTTKMRYFLRFLPLKTDFILSILCAALLAAVSPALGADYYVSPDGNDRNTGTQESPWRTAGHAGKQARAGDTVIFLPGDYTDTLEPMHSGTPQAPITFKAAKRREARLIGSDGGKWPEGRGGRMRLDGVEHIRIEGFHVEDTSVDESSGGWLWGKKVQGIEVVDCNFVGGHRWVLFGLHEAQAIRILNNDFARMRDGGDMVHINHSEDVLVEGNSFSFAMHSLFCIRYGSRAVVRGNVFHSGTSRNFENGDNTMTLVENNILTNGYSGGRSAGPANQTVGNRTIIRGNQVFKNYGLVWTIASASTRDTLHNRVYHNVFYGNYGYAWAVSSLRSNFRDLIFKNNVFALNDPYGSNTELVFNGGGTESVQVLNNAFHAGSPGYDALFRHGRNALSLKQAQADDASFKDTEHALTHTLKGGRGTRIPIKEAFHFVESDRTPAKERSLVFIGNARQIARVRSVDVKAGILEVDREVSWKKGAGVGFYAPAAHRGVFADNVEGDPRFANPERFDFSLAEDSFLLEAAAPLTVTRNSGQGDKLPVEDAYSFFDGFGVSGVQGDIIAVGNAQNRARVLHADGEKQILHLDRQLRWQAGDPVSLPWSGSAADIGAFEHGESGRVTVQVIAEAASVRPGEAVRLQAVVRGQAPAPLKYEWQLGDGTLAQGAEITHTYAKVAEYGYGIRVRVTDAQGDVALGVGYIQVEEGERNTGTLLHSTFNADDGQWWKHWRFYRGRTGSTYAYFRNIVNKDTGEGYIRIYPRKPAPTPLPAFIHPRNWDIDQYPHVYLRYRIKQGTPVAVFIRPYPSARHVLAGLDSDQDARRYYLAGTAGAAGDENSERRGRGPLPEGSIGARLIDDGQWHEITFDVRDIRKKYPDVQVLQAMHIGDLEVDGGAKVKPQDEFFLDEVYIGREKP